MEYAHNIWQIYYICETFLHKCESAAVTPVAVHSTGPSVPDQAR